MSHKTEINVLSKYKIFGHLKIKCRIVFRTQRILVLKQKTEVHFFFNLFANQISTKKNIIFFEISNHHFSISLNKQPRTQS
jgi:hypothetical protein